MSPHARKIINEVARAYGVPSHLLFAPLKERYILPPRYDAIRRLSAERSLSSTQIAEIFGMHHTGVLYALGRTKKGRGLKYGRVPAPEASAPPA